MSVAEALVETCGVHVQLACDQELLRRVYIACWALTSSMNRLSVREVGVGTSIVSDGAVQDTHRLFVGLGLGLGVPVVSYAPRPMFMASMGSLVIMAAMCELREDGCQHALGTRESRDFMIACKSLESLTHFCARARCARVWQLGAGVGQADERVCGAC